MKRTMIYASMFTVAVFFTLGICQVSEAADNVKTIRIHSQMPVGNYLTKSVDLFISEATKRSNGSLKFIHYPAQQLYKDSTICEAVPKGLIEMGMAMNISPWNGKAPEVNLAGLTCVWDDYDHYVRYSYDYVNGGGFEQYLYDIGKKKMNLINLGAYPYGRNMELLSKTPIRTEADWKGKKIRASAHAQNVFSEAMGATSIFTSSSETYMALQHGVMDGIQTGLTSMVSRKWMEIAKHVTDIPGLFPYEYHTFMNLDFWNSLDKTQKKVIMDSWLVAARYDEKEVYEEFATNKKILEKNGVTYYTLPKDVADAWKKKGIPKIKELLIKPAVGGNETEYNRILQMIEKTKNLPPSSDKPENYDLPFKMYDSWHKWFSSKEGLN
jgi:TRAP-type C4-dicarboxylate transport system substrate-binding protein